MPGDILVVDLQRIGLSQPEPSEEDYQAVGRDLYRAFSLNGFAYLSSHGVPSGQSERAFDASRKFFCHVDLDRKRKYARSAKNFHGFVEQNQEHLEASSTNSRSTEYRETFNITGFEEPDYSFPDADVPELRTSFRTISENLEILNRRVLRALAYSLKLEPDFFDDKHDKIFRGGNFTAIRSCYYPPLEGHIPPNSIRCSEHSDYGTLSFLFQDSLGGLQIKNREGSWIDATPIEGTILVNIADMLEIWTNGLFPATRHRVVIPAEEIHRRQARFSFVYFVIPNDDVIVAPLKGQGQGGQGCYEPVTPVEHLDKQFAKTYGDRRRTDK